jgi:acetyl esterase/lipase
MGGMKAPTLLAGLVSVLIAVAHSSAEDPLVLRVWPGKPPGETAPLDPEKYLESPADRPVKRLTNISDPTITVRKPPADKDTGAAVLICPGGGYHILAIDLEGDEVADWLNSIGVTGIVLKYRVPRREGRPTHEAPLQDAQRAMSLVRSKASELGIDPERIGILGFSAGANLSAHMSTKYGHRAYGTIDDIDLVSCRPDFAVLVYPAYLAVEGKLELNPDFHVDEKTPPAFLAHAADDPVTADSSLVWYAALTRAKSSAELHVYSTGGHGFGLRPSSDPCSSWPARCEEWMKRRGLLDKQ